jgi:hypothetical protein
VPLLQFDGERKCDLYLKSSLCCSYTDDVYRYKTIESIGKNFVTLYSSFFNIDSIGITYKCTRKKLEYKSYKKNSYRFYSFVPINIKSVCHAMQKSSARLLESFLGTWHYSY